jgi:hypothetical protein
LAPIAEAAEIEDGALPAMHKAAKGLTSNEAEIFGGLLVGLRR